MLPACPPSPLQASTRAVLGCSLITTGTASGQQTPFSISSMYISSLFNPWLKCPLLSASISMLPCAFAIFFGAPSVVRQSIMNLLTSLSANICGLGGGGGHGHGHLQQSHKFLKNILFICILPRDLISKRINNDLCTKILNNAIDKMK